MSTRRRCVRFATLGIVMFASFAGSMGASADARRAADGTAVIAQRKVVDSYEHALMRAAYGRAFALLNADGQRYYRTVANFRSTFDVDDVSVTAYSVAGVRSRGAEGSVFFLRETERVRDRAHGTKLRITRIVPLGVIPQGNVFRVREPGRPWRAFVASATQSVGRFSASVRQVAFFAQRIEFVVTFTNRDTMAYTILPYGRSVMFDTSGRRCAPIVTRDWALTDRTLFEGLRLPPNATYTGTLGFACMPRDVATPRFRLILAPLLADGADAPASIEIGGITSYRAVGRRQP